MSKISVYVGTMSRSSGFATPESDYGQVLWCTGYSCMERCSQRG